jgi:flagellin
MPLVINTNYSALAAQRNLSANQKMLSGSFEKLSSGLRVNTAADDAAGLAISESMKSQIRSYTVAERNASDGISMSQTAEASLGQVHDVMGRMRELATQSANGVLTNNDRAYIQQEFGLLKSEVTRIQGSAKYNGKLLIQAGAASTITFQVGLDNSNPDKITVTFGPVSLTDVASGGTATVATMTGAQNALSTIDAAIGKVSTARAKYGAAMNRLDMASNNISIMRLNIQAANSRIRDVDVASETSNLSRNQVLTQAGASVLAQANQLPQLAFGLLGR